MKKPAILLCGMNQLLRNERDAFEANMTKTADRHIGFMSRALEIAQRGWGQTSKPDGRCGHRRKRSDCIRRMAPCGRAESCRNRSVSCTWPKTGATSIALHNTRTLLYRRPYRCLHRSHHPIGSPQCHRWSHRPKPGSPGKGFSCLREAGIEVIDGVLSEACEDLNLIFNHWRMTQQSPLLAAKIATTLDGKFGAANGHSKWVTGKEARRCNALAPTLSAIAVSAATALADNPALTCRLQDAEWCPRRFVFDRQLTTIPRMDSLQLFNDAHARHTTLVCGPTVDAKKALATGIEEVWQLPEKAGHINLEAFRQRCAAEGIHAVYLETGPRWTSALLADQSVDYLFHYIAPKYMADSAARSIGQSRETTSITEAISVHKQRQENFGNDRLIRGWLRSTS